MRCKRACKLRAYVRALSDKLLMQITSGLPTIISPTSSLHSPMLQQAYMHVCVYTRGFCETVFRLPTTPSPAAGPRNNHGLYGKKVRCNITKHVAATQSEDSDHRLSAIQLYRKRCLVNVCHTGDVEDLPTYGSVAPWDQWEPHVGRTSRKRSVDDCGWVDGCTGGRGGRERGGGGEPIRAREQMRKS